MPIWRFTPTCVGTTRLELINLLLQAVHPHVCGDNVAVEFPKFFENGSPPRVWGQLLQALLDRIISRFTPTCVGTTYEAFFTDGGEAVHPHVCGDNDTHIVIQRLVGGSPPRVWGQQSSQPVLCSIIRFTPTCVGTTVKPCQPIRNCAVHPHVCGDNSSI